MAQDQELRYRILANVVGGAAVTGLSNSFKGLTSAYAGFATAIAGSAVVAFGQSLINTADEMQALSEKTGIAAEDLFSFEVAAKTANTSLDALSGAFKKLATNQVEAAGGNKQLQAAFSAIGVAVKDAEGRLKPTSALVSEISDRFAKLPDGPEKAALAVKIFGKAGADLIPFLNQGSGALNEFRLAFGGELAARADQFNDTLTKIGAGVKVQLLEGLNAALPALQEVVDSFKDFGPSGETVRNVFIGIGEAARLVTQGLDSFITFFVQGADTIVAAARNLFSKVGEIFERLSLGFSTVGKQIAAAAALDFDRVASLNEELQTRSAEIEKNGSDERLRINDEYSKRLEDRQKAFLERSQKRLANSIVAGLAEGKSLEDILAKQRADNPVNDRQSTGAVAEFSDSRSKQFDSETKAIDAYRASQTDALELRKLEIESMGLSSEETRRLVENKKLEQDAIRATKDFTEENREAYLQITQDVIAYREELAKLEAQQKSSFSVGARQAFNDYLEQARDVASQSKDLFSTAFKGIEDALVGFVKTGKLNFENLANDIIEQLIRIQIKAAFVSAFGGPSAGGAPGLASLFGFADGGVMTDRGPMPLKKYASGGIANSPQLAMYGEGSRPEAFVPLPDGRRIPVAMQGASGGGDVINISVNVSNNQTQVEGNSESGKQLAGLIAVSVQNEIVKQKRPGGLLA